MELLHVDEIPRIPNEKGRSLKQIFGEIRDFEELAERFTFYVPIVYHLVSDEMRTPITTDIVSHTLAHVMQEHPLVVTDLARQVFRFSKTLLLAHPELRSSLYKLYAVPTPVWNQVLSHLQLLTLIDQAAHRFCVLTPHTLGITNPLGRHADLVLNVQFFACYGNQETYYFQDQRIVIPGEPDESSLPEEPPRLCYHPPIQEFIALADRILMTLAQNKRLPMEQAMENASREMTEKESPLHLLAIQKKNNLHDKIATPITESSLSEPYARQCRDIIRFYESTFGSAPGSNVPW